jgi:hypothetical protein
MRRKRWSVVLALLTVAIGSGVIATALAGAAPQRTPRLIAGTWTGRRPRNIYISGDGGNIITKIHWRAWKSSYAYGAGTSNILGCVPNCASGSATPVRTTVTLSHPRSGHWTKLLEIRQGRRLIARYGHPLWPIGAR